MVYLDFSIAFDTIDHQLMCAKLRYYRFDDTSVVFSNLPCEQEDYCKELLLITLSHMWEAYTPICVPQGSALGPLLFILFYAKMAPVCQTHMSE